MRSLREIRYLFKTRYEYSHTILEYLVKFLPGNDKEPSSSMGVGLEETIVLALMWRLFKVLTYVSVLVLDGSWVERGGGEEW